jgi:cytochrome c553
MTRIFTGLAMAGLLAGIAGATPALGKKEAKECITCHTKKGTKDLNDTGKYYKDKKTLQGAPAPEAPKK